MSSSVTQFPPSRFCAGKDVLLIDLLDRGSGGKDLALEVLFEEADFEGEAGTFVKLRPLAPCYGDRDVMPVARLVGISPDEFGERDIVLRDISA